MVILNRSSPDQVLLDYDTPDLGSSAYISFGLLPYIVPICGKYYKSETSGGHKVLPSYPAKDTDFYNSQLILHRYLFGVEDGEINGANNDNFFPYSHIQKGV